MEDNRTRTSSASTADGSEVSTALPHDLLTEEVLTRLPANSLLRFKCVSKLWRSTIADPSFSKARRARSSSSPPHAAGILIIKPNYDSDSSLHIFYATLPCQGHSSLVCQFTHPLLRRYLLASSRVINGLVFLHTLTDDSVALFNTATREFMELQLPSSNLDNVTRLANCLILWKNMVYYLGVDCSTSKEYKLLKICSIVRIFLEDGVTIQTTESEILTLGKDTTWRSLDSPPVIDLIRESVYIHIKGVIYWWVNRIYPREGLVAFDFENESFLNIPPPPSTSRYGELRQFRDHLAVVSWSFHDLEVWVLELGLRPQFKWIKHVINNLPYELDFHVFQFQESLPTGELLMADSTIDEHGGLSVYSYDQTKGSFTNFVIGNFESTEKRNIDHNNFRIYYYEEDLTPLNEVIKKNTM